MENFPKLIILDNLRFINLLFSAWFSFICPSFTEWPYTMIRFVATTS